MKIGIVYESKTGNTKIIAESIREVCQEAEHKVIFKDIKDLDSKSEEVDLYFLGSWTDKGDCGDSINEFCKGLNKQKIALFGTAGFGGSAEYYQSLTDRFADALAEDNTIMGSFYCQGKMPTGIRNRYTKLLRENPEDEKLEVSIENFDKAQSHPDKDDIQNVKEFAKNILKQV